MGKSEDINKRCSFCGKTQEQVKKLVVGPESVYICDECIMLCSEIIEDEFYNDTPIEDSEENINLIKIGRASGRERGTSPV